jgi:hypothetical protein
VIFQQTYPSPNLGICEKESNLQILHYVKQYHRTGQLLFKRSPDWLLEFAADPVFNQI